MCLEICSPNQSEEENNVFLFFETFRTHSLMYQNIKNEKWAIFNLDYITLEFVWVVAYLGTHRNTKQFNFKGFCYCNKVTCFPEFDMRFFCSSECMANGISPCLG